MRVFNFSFSVKTKKKKGKNSLRTFNFIDIRPWLIFYSPSKRMQKLSLNDFEKFDLYFEIRLYIKQLSINDSRDI